MKAAGCFRRPTAPVGVLTNAAHLDINEIIDIAAVRMAAGDSCSGGSGASTGAVAGAMLLVIMPCRKTAFL